MIYSMFLVFYLVPSLALIAVVSFLVLFVLQKFRKKKLSPKQRNMIILSIISIYLLIGLYLSFDYLFLPNKYTQQYVLWLKQTPLDERLMNITTWPMLFIQMFIIRK
jgi:hypothetical protein